MRWDDERDRKLLALRAENLSCAQVGERMGISRNAVIGRLHRLQKRGAAAIPPSSESDEPVPITDLAAYFEDCYWPVARMKKLVEDTLDEDYDATEPYHRAALFLVCCGLIGPSASWAAEATGLDHFECCQFDSRARLANIIIDGKTDIEPWIEGEPLRAMIMFVLDCFTVADMVEYTGERDDRRYWLKGTRPIAITASVA